MIWQHKILIWTSPPEEPDDDQALRIRQVEARYDAIGADGWELVTTTSLVLNDKIQTWTIWKRPFIEKAVAA